MLQGNNLKDNGEYGEPWDNGGPCNRKCDYVLTLLPVVAEASAQVVSRLLLQVFSHSHIWKRGAGGRR